MNEKWKPIPGYDGDYEVSTKGRVRSLKWNRPRILKQNFRHNAKAMRTSWYAVCLYDPQGRKATQYVHTLVWWTFKGEIPEKMEIHQINGDTTDNRLENLGLRDIIPFRRYHD